MIVLQVLMATLGLLFITFVVVPILVMALVVVCQMWALGYREARSWIKRRRRRRA